MANLRTFIIRGEILENAGEAFETKNMVDIFRNDNRELEVRFVGRRNPFIRLTEEESVAFLLEGKPVTTLKLQFIKAGWCAPGN